VDTYRYFGEPVYVYSLKEGSMTLLDAVSGEADFRRRSTIMFIRLTTKLVEGEIETGRIYTEPTSTRLSRSKT